MKTLTIACIALNLGITYLLIAGKLTPIHRSRIKQISETWQVVSIADADTIAVKRNGEQKKLRLCGIDAPETAHRLGEISQPGGDEAKKFVTDLLKASDEVSVTFIEKDKYGRWIAEVFVSTNDGTDREIFLNEELVSTGRAWTYEDYWDSCPNKAAIASAKERAIATGIYIGLNPANQKPSAWRRSH